MAVKKQRAAQKDCKTTENVQWSNAATWLIFGRRYAGLIAACPREELSRNLKFWQPLLKFPFPTFNLNCCWTFWFLDVHFRCFSNLQALGAWTSNQIWIQWWQTNKVARRPCIFLYENWRYFLQLLMRIGSCNKCRQFSYNCKCALAVVKNIVFFLYNSKCALAVVKNIVKFFATANAHYQL